MSTEVIIRIGNSSLSRSVRTGKRRRRIAVDLVESRCGCGETSTRSAHIHEESESPIRPTANQITGAPGGMQTQERSQMGTDTTIEGRGKIGGSPLETFAIGMVDSNRATVNFAAGILTNPFTRIGNGQNRKD